MKKNIDKKTAIAEELNELFQRARKTLRNDDAAIKAYVDYSLPLTALVPELTFSEGDYDGGRFFTLRDMMKLFTLFLDVADLKTEDARKALFYKQNHSGSTGSLVELTLSKYANIVK